MINLGQKDNNPSRHNQTEKFSSMKKCASNTRTKEVKLAKQRGKDLFCVLCFLDLFSSDMLHAMKACGNWIIKIER